jgi:TolB-like protein
MSGDPEQEYFSDGMTDTLITDLSRVPGLFVIARNSTFAYKGKAAQIKDVGRELGVRYVVEGSVQKAADRVRINAQLIDVSTGGHLWAERYDGELKDIFALQDEITQKIAAALAVKLTATDQERVKRQYTTNLEAYDYYLRGVESFYRFTREANVQARQMFDKAISLDPEFAAAYARLSFTHLVEWIFQWSQDPQTLERAFALARKAIALDDSLPDAHGVLGAVYGWRKQLDQAIVEVQRAIALDPNYAEAYATLGMILYFTGRLEEAIEEVKKAMRLNPYYPTLYLFHLGNAYYLAGRHEEAIAALKRVLARTPDFLGAHAVLAVVYSELGRLEEAQAEAAEVLRINPSFSLEVWRQNLPHKEAEVERMLAGLRKAGLK